MVECVISADEIREALRFGGRLDGSSLVLGYPDGRIERSTAEWGVHRPPYLVAAYQFEPYGERWPEERGPDQNEHSWGMREFERLSLAARAALSLAHQTGSSGAIQDAARAVGVNWKSFPIVYAEDILKELASLADELGPDQGKDGALPTEEQLAMRGGLQIVGFRIRSKQAKDGLRLVNARLPVSLRFIGCVFECPILLAHCELVSLDLSGSAMDTLDATGLIASGSVYLRRTLVRTPVSFSSARIGGAFNASDAVIAPMTKASLTTPVNPDYGVLNLSGATIDNEVRLDRARIWGGLSLRGAVVGRSMSLSHALVTSPLGLLEKRLGDLLIMARRLPRSGPPTPAPVERAGDLVCSMARFDARFASFLHDGKKPVGAFGAKVRSSSPAYGQALRQVYDDDSDPGRIAALAELEILTGETHRWRALTSRTLMKLSSRALTSAVRADNLKVEGSLNARGMVANGQFRMKYAEVRGAVRFDGAVLRSAGHCRETVNTLLEHERTAPSPALELAETIEALRSLNTHCTSAVQRSEREISRLRARITANLTSTCLALSDRREGEPLMRALKSAEKNRGMLQGAREKSGRVLERLERHSGGWPVNGFDMATAHDLLTSNFGCWRFSDVWTTLTGESGDEDESAERRTYFEHRWRTGEHWAAVNMRDSQIAGDVSFGGDPAKSDAPTQEEFVQFAGDPTPGSSSEAEASERADGDYSSDPKHWKFRDVSHPVELFGSILMDSVTAGGSVMMCRMNVVAPEVLAKVSRTPVSRPLGRPKPRPPGKSVRLLWTEVMFSKPARVRQEDRATLRPTRAGRLRTIQMRQVRIGRDIDLRRSVGVAGVNLENGSIGGDLKFSSSATPRRPREADLKSRFFTCNLRAEKVGGTVSLRSTKVGGDAILVFDPWKGPDIDAGMLVVDGQLEINPQVGATSYQKTPRPAADGATNVGRTNPLGARTVDADLTEGFWLDACDHEPVREPSGDEQAMPAWRTCRHCNVVMDAMDSSLSWKIDLSRARATVFAHPPAAWPNPGALALDGFAYQQVSETGPLHPRHRVVDKDTYTQHRWQRFIWRRHPLDGFAARLMAASLLPLAAALVTWLLWEMLNRGWSLHQAADLLERLGMATALLVGVGALLGLAYNLRKPPQDRTPWRALWHIGVGFVAVGICAHLGGKAIEWIKAQPDAVLGFAPALTTIILGIVVASVLTTTSRVFRPGWGLSRHWPFIHAHQTTPRALEYLARQRVVESRFKLRSSSHPVLETYVRAAKVLRDAGRFVSANAVEEERLRLRTRMLSWRHHGAAKTAMLSVEIFSGYGFRLWRATLTIAALVCAVASLGHLAAANGFLVRQAPLEAPANHRSIAALEAERLQLISLDRPVDGLKTIAPDYRPPCGVAERQTDGRDLGVLEQDCPDFVYAADLLLPFIDMKEADRWKTSIPEGTPGRDAEGFLRRTFDEPALSLVVSLIYLWPSFVGVLGLFLTAVVGAAAATRIEAALARVEE